ncbi:MAG: right-handed parallel beta-helix repeat-containing protein, partial [Aggregatilineales bacterium]
YLWKPLSESYGGGILLHDVKDSTIKNCDVQHQMNGILLYDCDTITAEQNNGSFNSGWGIYLSNTQNSLIQDNQFDFCNRVFKRENGIVRVEADAAGIVIVKGSSKNRFLRNSCLCGGDGIFLCGYEHPGSITPCNDNLFEDNDCRLSPNNAIEATFSGNNIFRGNDCSRSNYGFWMGYSYDCTLEDNHVEFSRWAGIAIEHAYGFNITGNTVANNGEGIRLFTRGGAVTDYFENRRVCSNFTIRDNQIEHNDIGFHGYTGAETDDNLSHNFLLENNTFDNNRVGAQLHRVNNARLLKNQFTANIVAAIQHDNHASLVFNDNHFDANHRDIVSHK